MIFEIEDHQNAQNSEPNPMVMVVWPGGAIFVPYITTILYRGGTYFPPTVYIYIYIFPVRSVWSPGANNNNWGRDLLFII